MTIYTHSGNLPHHLDIYADSSFFAKEPSGFWPVRWFGLTAKYGEMWGCNLMLECGAVYRNIPPHALAFREDPEPVWEPGQAQAWDCYGPQFTTLIYDVLVNVDCVTNHGHEGTYLFTAVPLFDGFSKDPSQSKEFMFIRLDNGRLTIKSTDMVLFKDKSFTSKEAEWPRGLKKQTEVWHCE
jgi:hypothetical protein